MRRFLSLDRQTDRQTDEERKDGVIAILESELPMDARRKGKVCWIIL